MDFIGTLTSKMAGDTAYMDYYVRRRGSIPYTLSQSDSDTKLSFYSAYLSDPGVNPNVPGEIFQTLDTPEAAAAALTETVTALDNGTLPYDRVAGITRSVLDSKNLDSETIFNFVKKTVSGLMMSREDTLGILASATIPYGSDAEKIAWILTSYDSAFNVEGGANSRRRNYGEYNGYSAIVRNSTSRDVTVRVFAGVAATNTYSEIFSALALSPILDYDLVTACFAEAGLEPYAVSEFLSVCYGNTYVSTSNAGSAISDKEIRVEVADALCENLLNDPNVSDYVRGAVIYDMIRSRKYDESLAPLARRVIQNIATPSSASPHNVKYQNDQFKNRLNKEIIASRVFSLFPAVYTATNGTDTDSRRIRSGLIEKTKDFPETLYDNSAETADALWVMVDSGNPVTATPAAQESLIKSGRLSRELMESLCSRRSRLGKIAKAKVAEMEAAALVNSDGVEEDVVIEVPKDWDADVTSGTGFSAYVDAAIAGGFTPIGALALWAADTRMKNEDREEARKILVDVLNHTPDYVNEVPEEAWAAFMRLREPMDFNHEVLIKMNESSNSGARLASKNLVKTSLF